MQSELIELKVMIYKLSPKQMEYLLREELLLEVVSEENKNILLEKIKVVSRVVDQLIEFGLFAKCYL